MEKKIPNLRVCGLTATMMWEHEFVGKWKNTIQIYGISQLHWIRLAELPQQLFQRKDERSQTAWGSRSASTELEEKNYNLDLL